MSQENVEIVRSLYEVWNRSGGVVPLESIDPGIEVEMVGGILSGSYRGHAGLSKALESFWDPSTSPASTSRLALKPSMTSS